jgi:hypothetical protein
MTNQAFCFFFFFLEEREKKKRKSECELFVREGEMINTKERKRKWWWCGLCLLFLLFVARGFFTETKKQTKAKNPTKVDLMRNRQE